MVKDYNMKFYYDVLHINYIGKYYVMKNYYEDYSIDFVVEDS